MRADSKLLLFIASLFVSCAGVQASDKELLRSDARLRTDSYTEFGLDTGTGALRQSVRVMSLLGGVRKLDFDIDYNSMVNESSGFGTGWSHPFDGFITTSGPSPEKQRPWRHEFPNVTVTYAGGRHTSSFTRSISGGYVPNGPFNLQDRLVLDTGDEQEGFFKFTRPDGTTYLYRATGIPGSHGKLQAVIDHKQSPIIIDRDKRGRITALKTSGSDSTFVGSQWISSSLRFHWLPQFGEDAVEQVNAVERYSPGNSRWRHFAYANENLSRIYDPVELEPVPVFYQNFGLVEIPEGQSQRFTLSVGELPSDRLLLIDADIENGPAKLTFYTVNPAATYTIDLGHSGPGRPIRLMTDAFLAENLRNRSTELYWHLDVTNIKEKRFDFDANGELIRRENAPTIVKRISVKIAKRPVGYTEYYTSPAFASRERTLLTHVSVSEGGEAPREVRNMAYDSSNRLIRVSTNPDPASGLGQSHQEIAYFTLDGKRYTDVHNRSPDLWLNRSSFNWDPYRRWVHTPELDLLSFADAEGNTTHFAYDAEHRRTQIQDPLGNVTQLGYTPEGKVASITWPNEAVSTFTYDELEPMSAQPLPPGEVLESYDLHVDRMLSPNDLPGANTFGVNNTIWVGVEEGTIGTIYRKLKHIRIYDDSGDIVFDRTDQFFKDNGETASDQAFEDLETTAIQWLDAGYNNSTEADRLAFIDLLIDSIPESIDVKKKGNLQTITAPGAGVTTFHYNEYNNLICVKDALQGEQNITCNADGSVSGISNQGLDGIELGRNGEGRVDTISQAGEGAPPQEIKYDFFGRVTEIKDSAGYATTYGYDDRDNITSVQGGGNPVLSEYDYRNRLSKKNIKMRGGVMKAEITYEYDIHNNVIKTTDAAGAETTFEYDIEDRLIKVTNPRGFSDEFEYDAASRLVGKTDRLNNVTHYVYDAASNLIRTFLNGEIQIETTYNEMNLPATTTDGEGNQTTFDYDDLGRLTGTTDPRGRTTNLEYDLLGRLVKTTDPLGREYIQTYFEDNVVEEVKLEGDPGGTSFDYTNSNEVKSIALPSGATTHFEYTANGFVKSFMPPIATEAQYYSYDSENRLSRTDYAPLPIATVYSYDDDGNLTSIGSQEGGDPVTPVINRTYDIMGRLLTHEDGRDKMIRYEYDAMGLVTRITYPNGNTVDYVYDGGNRLLSTTDWAGRVTKYTWNRFNQITLIAFPNTTFREMEYDQSGKLKKRTDYAGDGTVIVSYVYTLDPKGRIVAEQVFPAIEPALPTAKDFTYGQDNQVTVMNGINISHDLNGRMTQGVVQGQSRAMRWDYRGNMDQVGSTQYRYNLQDRLIGWEKGGEEVFFTIVETSDRPRMFQSETSSGSTTQYVYGVGLTYEVTDGVLKVHHFDERGSTVALSDDQGAVSGRLSYAPYGEITSESGTVDTLFKFGGLWGTVTSPDGLNSMGFRWYSPEMSRFLSLDSVYGNLESPGSLNRYHFAFGDPVNLVDPNGEAPSYAVVALVGAIAGVVVEFVSNEIGGKPHSAENYLAAAIGGAVGAVVGVASKNPAAGGAAGAGTTNLLKAAFNGEKVDVSSFILDTIAGGITGGILGAAGDKLGKGTFQAGLAGLGTAARVVATELATSIAAGPLDTAFKGGSAFIGKSLERNEAFANKLATSTSAGLLAHYNAPNTTSKEGSGLKDYSNAFRIMERTLIKPTASIGSGGEQAAYKLYLKAMRQADQHPPNPLLNLPAF